jgi:hypothetical protein
MIRLALSFVFAAAVIAVLYLRFDVVDAVYAMPLAAINEIIDRTDLPPMIFEGRAFNARHWRSDPKTSMWAVLGQGEVELLRLKAEAIAGRDNVRVHVEALPPVGALHDEVRQEIAENGSNVALLTTALAEQIDANLNGREFDLKRISPAIARVTLEALPHLRESLNNAAKESDRREQDTVDRAYENEKP